MNREQVEAVHPTERGRFRVVSDESPMKAPGAIEEMVEGKSRYSKLDSDANDEALRAVMPVGLRSRNTSEDQFCSAPGMMDVTEGVWRDNHLGDAVKDFKAL